MQVTSNGDDSFYTSVRENVIALLLFLAALGAAHWFTEEYRVKPFARAAQTRTGRAGRTLRAGGRGPPRPRGRPGVESGGGNANGEDSDDQESSRGVSLDDVSGARAAFFAARPAEPPAFGQVGTLCGWRGRVRNRGHSENVDLLEAASPYYQGVLGLVPNLLCSAALAVALSGFVLPLVTIVFTGCVRSQPDRAGEWIEWLDTSLLSRLWRYTFHGIHVSLFLLVPFAYFYSEADIVRGAAAKARESGLILSMTAVLGYGLIYVVKRLLDAENISDTSVIEFFTAGASAVLCLSLAPAGFMSLLSAIKDLPLRPNYRRELQDLLVQLQFETEVVRQRLEALEPPDERDSKLPDAQSGNGSWNLARRRKISERAFRTTDRLPASEPAASRASPTKDSYPAAPRGRRRSSSWAGRDSPGMTRRVRSAMVKLPSQANLSQAKIEARQLAARMEELQMERLSAMRNSGQSPLRRNLLFLVLFFLSAAAWCLFVAAVTLSLVHGLLPNSSLREILHGGGSFVSESATSPQLGRRATPTTFPEPPPPSRMVPPAASFNSPLSLLFATELPVVETAVVVYFCLGLAAGVLTSPTFAGLRPRPHATGTRELSGFIAIGLFLASSLPFVVRILGLSASLPLPWDLDDAIDSFPGGKVWVLSAYRLVMLIRTTYYMLDSILFSRLK